MTLEHPEFSGDGSIYATWTEKAFTAHLVASAETFRHLRELTGRVLSGHCSIDSVESAQLVLSELVGNAVRAWNGGDHPPLVVEVEASVGGILVCVTDPSPDKVPRRSTLQLNDPEAESGRGLVLVEALCEQWFVSSVTQVSKTVCCILPV
jgi:anti-sigma regulatory factor (Ser/Thr protein kinase)